MAATYRLGNQPEEYELETKYLGWIPENFTDWDKWVWDKFPKSHPRGSDLIMVSPDKNERITLILDHGISKEAFPLSFYGEDRANDWHRFLIVSLQETPEKKFIIPMH